MQLLHGLVFYTRQWTGTVQQTHWHVVQRTFAESFCGPWPSLLFLCPPPIALYTSRLLSLSGWKMSALHPPQVAQGGKRGSERLDLSEAVSPSEDWRLWEGGVSSLAPWLALRQTPSLIRRELQFYLKVTFTPLSSHKCKEMTAPRHLKAWVPLFRPRKTSIYYIRFGRYPYDTYTTQITHPLSITNTHWLTHSLTHTCSSSHSSCRFLHHLIRQPTLSFTDTSSRLSASPTKHFVCLSGF